MFLAFKPVFAEPKRKASDAADDRYVRDDYQRGHRGGADRYERSGAPGGYPYGDRDRDRGNNKFHSSTIALDKLLLSSKMY